LAECTAPVPRWVNPSHTTRVLEGQAAREDANLRRLMSDPHGVTASWAESEPLKAEWLLGNFLTHKLVESQAAGAEGRAAAREAAVQAVVRSTVLPEPGLQAPGAVLSSDGRQHALAPSGGFEGFGAGVESRLGLVSPGHELRRQSSPQSSRKELGLRSSDDVPGKKSRRGRPCSAPPGQRGAMTSQLWPSKVPGSEDGITDLMSRPLPSVNCPSCGKKVEVPKKLLSAQHPEKEVLVKTGPSQGTGKFDPTPRRVARVVSSAFRHGNRADFYIDNKKIHLEGGKFALHELSRRGFNIVTVDPDSQQVMSAMSYDTSSSAQVASTQMAADLNALPEGRVVLVAVRGSGLEGLSSAALRALRRVGATGMASGGRAQEGYALIGSKGGTAVAERKGHVVEVEGEVPRPPWQEPQDLSWYFQQQKQFLSDLKVSEDRHEAWTSKVFAQENEIDGLKSKILALEKERDGLRNDLKEALRERDEWQVSALRVMSKREFRSSVEAMEASKPRHLSY